MKTVLESLNTHLHQAMQADERVYLLGEDLLDPYGGAFKVTRGLSSSYPERVLTSPISEAGIVGVAGGMALRGLLPVVEIMFGDFVTLIADQLINSIAKFRWMYNEQVNVPLVVRAPMGGRRGYGPTHSQTLEKLFIGTPGLRVLAPSAVGDPGALLSQAILADNIPVLFAENKLLYLSKLNDPKTMADFDLQSSTMAGSYAPIHTLRLRHAPPPTLTLAAYGYMAELGREAALRLAYEHELFCELIVLTQLTPVAPGPGLPDPLLASLKQTGSLLVVEEGTYTLGWGAEIVTRAAQSLGPKLKRSGRIAAQDLPIPASVPMEQDVLPDVEQIMQTAIKMMGRSL